MREGKERTAIQDEEITLQEGEEEMAPPSWYVEHTGSAALPKGENQLIKSPNAAHISHRSSLS